MKYYIYSNKDGSLGVSNKVLRQADLLGVPDLNVIRIQWGNFIKLFLFFLRASSSNIYVRESLITSVFLFLLPKKHKLVCEANRQVDNYSGRRSGLFLRLRSFFAKVLYRRADKIVCVTSEIKQSFLGHGWHDKVLVFSPNFYSYPEHIKKRSVQKRDYDVVFIGDSRQAWQNPELIERLARLRPELKVLHIGKGKFSASNVIDYGVVNDREILFELLESADVAISQLGLSRIGMTEAYPLKHCDYAAVGIPIITGADDKLLNGVYPLHFFNEDNENSLLRVIRELQCSGPYYKLDILKSRINKYKEVYASVLDF